MKHARKRVESEESFGLRDTLIWCGIPIVIVLLVRMFLFGFYVIPSGSMLNTIEPGDRVITSKLTPKVFKLQRGDEQIEDVAIGTGPLDASFKAINRMLHMDVKLESFSLNAVTDGEDAIGEAVVKVSGPDGRSYTGSGLSTDIIESSIRAYVNGINKIMESGN